MSSIRSFDYWRSVVNLHFLHMVILQNKEWLVVLIIILCTDVFIDGCVIWEFSYRCIWGILGKSLEKSEFRWSRRKFGECIELSLYFTRCIEIICSFLLLHTLFKGIHINSCNIKEFLQSSCLLEITATINQSGDWILRENIIAIDGKTLLQVDRLCGFLFGASDGWRLLVDTEKRMILYDLIYFVDFTWVDPWISFAL